MTVINAYSPTAMCVGANIEEQDEFFCDLAKLLQPTEPVSSFTSPATSTPSWVLVTSRKTS